MDPALNMRDPSSAMLGKKQETYQYCLIMHRFSSRLFPPDYPKDGPNGRSPYLSSCKLHGGHHDQHGDHHGGKGHHGGHRDDPEKNPFSPLDSPHAPPSGSLPASPVSQSFFSLQNCHSNWYPRVHTSFSLSSGLLL